MIAFSLHGREGVREARSWSRNTSERYDQSYSQEQFVLNQDQNAWSQNELENIRETTHNIFEKKNIFKRSPTKSWSSVGL
jgi:hypothetical protein